MVTLQIIKLLQNDYEIHLIPFSKIEKDKILYDIPEKVIIEDIGFKDEISQFDLNFYNKINNKKYRKAIKLLFSCINTYVFGRFKIRKQLEKMSNKDDIFIFTSSELLAFAPKNRLVVQHFHFNSTLYKNFVSKMFRCISKRPNFYIFLSESTEENINKKHKLKSTVIYNPSRFERKENFEYHNNTLISVCRFEDQKNPLMLLKIAKELDNQNFNYTFNIYGTGSLKGKMEKYIEKNNLKNVHLISGISKMEPYYLESDLYVIVSKFEGFPLSVIEANSLSLPIIWKEMSDPTNSIMKDDYNGYIIDSEDPKLFADKIIKTLSDKEKLRKLKENSYEISKKYEEERIVEVWKKTLDGLFDSIK